MKKGTYCYNCGNMGHLYKSCHFPIISLGVICVQINKKCLTLEDFQKENKILIIRRKDSIGYTDFLRGKYNMTFNSLINIINIMTNKEKDRILSNDFENMWKNLWVIKVNNFNKDYEKCLSKYSNLMKNGIIYENKNISLKEIIVKSNTNYSELEWGFPKGKRNKDEKDMNVAIREFNEETNLNDKNYNLINIKPLIENYIGTDNKKYRHVYYLSILNDNKIDIGINKNNVYQQTEISSIGFYNYKDSLNLIRPYNKERMEIIKSVYKIMFYIENNKLSL